MVIIFSKSEKQLNENVNAWLYTKLMNHTCMVSVSSVGYDKENVADYII